ncbi:maleylpyruvate isomerase N-terminal domain-containing protein [Actinosynnema sp. NPDC047251]|uniref:maleylpyruvate isomerase N-terminal domain-containing protein n=1 Tax=Saccharothrix espanaensis TaxID=103731 RepID=UPI0002D8C823|nr:maleylpyruvate isomerase N-terminal domain-containing protein [Saccharothrix espanaensis]
MEHQDLLDQAHVQYRALRAAAITAGPGTPVPTCPGWDVAKLVHHLAGVNSWALAALNTAPDGDRPGAEPRPEGWEELLAWWDDRFTAMNRVLADAGPDAPAWTFAGPRSTAFWIRRQAHEMAIHRLDVEHALHGPEVPSLLFDPEFAADGVDEFLTVLLPRAAQRDPVDRVGRLLWHAADAGRTWEVALVPGEPPAAGPAVGAATDQDTTAAGTADALYRLAWDRPSGAIVSGDRSLVDALPRP